MPAQKKSNSLAAKKCLPCDTGGRPLPPGRARRYLHQVTGWKLGRGGKTIFSEFLMKDFSAAVDLIRRIAVVANRKDHHPDIFLTRYRKLRIELSTHSIGGLSENDFILAANIDRLPKKLKTRRP